MLRAILNKSWRQHPTKQQLYSHLSLITKTIQVRQTRHAENCWRSRDELISDILLWTPSHGRAKAGWPARTYIQQLCAGTVCSLEDLPGAMDDKEGWRRGSGRSVLAVRYGDDDNSAAFKQFAKEWRFGHHTSSSKYPQSNGFAEHCMQSRKSAIKKAKSSSCDIDMVLLCPQTTLIDHTISSPGETVIQQKIG